ncbi:MAG TPA: hypothetical protein VKX40_03375, partial [Aequorivita sp.]|nr:hypothetical protein [Aequorivita sp.]
VSQNIIIFPNPKANFNLVINVQLEWPMGGIWNLVLGAWNLVFGIWNLFPLNRNHKSLHPFWPGL